MNATKATKAKVLGIGLLGATIAAVALSPAIRGHATHLPIPQPATTQAIGKAKVEVVFVLDTTGSMSGLIDAAKEKIWSIATTMAQANPAPEISMGLVAYRDRGDAYVTQVVDLSNDLDSMYATLMDFAADGGGDGPESVNQALDEAIHGMSWSQEDGSYKVVFLVGDAPPHMDYQDDGKYPATLASAAAKGIVVNTIQCGSMFETAGHWQRIAALGNGRYFQVEQAGSAVVISTPFDTRIAELSAQLDATRIYYGTAGEREAFDRKIAATQKLHESASTAAQARRGVFNASVSGAVNLIGDHDLVEDVASGRVELDAVPAAELPPSLAAMPADEQHRLLEETAARRESLQQQINGLAEQRDAFISEKLEESGGAADSLDLQIYDAVREQATTKGLSYESGPKY
jgi:Mg-chelatase subunit ChlD